MTDTRPPALRQYPQRLPARALLAHLFAACTGLGIATSAWPQVQEEAAALEPTVLAAAPTPARGAAPASRGSATMSSNLSLDTIDPKTTEYIVAVVNQEPITSTELNRRLQQALQETPSTDPSTRETLRKQVLETLIEEKAQLAYAFETGLRIDDADVDRAMESIAMQNEITVRQLRDRLRQDGQDYAGFRRMLRERIMLERLREREVPGRIRIPEADVDKFIEEQMGRPTTVRELSLAQIMIALPPAPVDVEINEARARAEQVLKRARAGEDFSRLAREFSQDKATREAGGQMGWRAADGLPEAFVTALTTLKAGDLAPELVRTEAGFHVLKLAGRREALAGYSAVQNHARHILLRPSGLLTPQLAYDRLMQLRQHIIDGQASFAQLARQHSQDGTATKGGDLGWTSTGQFVPEFQQALDRMQPGQLSMPITSRFGIHLVQLMERRQVPVDPKQLRDNARTALREQRFEAAYKDWAREIRSLAYVEMRDIAQP